eukprot:m.198415 g.198415  ORF g.198415 m.198415 type:complete len:359 (+) comp18746_c0_seq1:230-1306(+)
MGTLRLVAIRVVLMVLTPMYSRTLLVQCVENYTADETISFNEAVSDGPVFDEGFEFDFSLSCARPQECEGVARLLLYPEEYVDAVTARRDGGDGIEDYLRNTVGNLFMSIDAGINSDGDPEGGAGDGLVRTHELSNRVYGCIKSWQYEDDQKWRTARDANSDGLVDLDELDATLDDASRTRFEAADASKDAWLSDEDIGRFRNPLWHSDMEAWAAAAFFHDLDTDKDMKVTKKEFLRTPKWETEKFLTEAAVLPYVLEREFSRVDTNADGIIDLKEVKRLPDQRRQSVVTHGVNMLLTLLDQDRDGSISAKELEDSPFLLISEADYVFLDHDMVHVDHELVDMRYDEEINSATTKDEL